MLFNGKVVRTAIYKEPINGTSRIALRRPNLDGDRQADLTVHGGPDKAVYAYPSEHYKYWRYQLPAANLSYGTFGEMELVSKEKNKVTVKDIVRLYVDDKEDIVTMRRVGKNQGIGQRLEGLFSATNRESCKVDDECMLEDNNISNNLLKASQYNDKLIDSSGRIARKLRISITDRCNMRCVYCMPTNNTKWFEQNDVLSYEEIARLVNILVTLGVEKIRITGGEPLVRPKVEDLIGALSKIKGIKADKYDNKRTLAAG